MVFEKDGRCRGTEREAVGPCRWGRIGRPPMAVLASGQGTTYWSVSPREDGDERGGPDGLTSGTRGERMRSRKRWEIRNCSSWKSRSWVFSDEGFKPKKMDSAKRLCWLSARTLIKVSKRDLEGLNRGRGDQEADAVSTAQAGRC